MNKRDNLTGHRCFGCGEYLCYNIAASQYECLKCGKKWDREEYFTILTRKELKIPARKKSKEKSMSKKGECIICGRTNVTILGRDCCGSCYPIGKKFKWNVEEAKKYRTENPINDRKATKGKTKPARCTSVPVVPEALVLEKGLPVKTEFNITEAPDANGFGITKKLVFEIEINIKNVRMG